MFLHQLTELLVEVVLRQVRAVGFLMNQPEAFKANIRRFVRIRDPLRTLLLSRQGSCGLSTVAVRLDGVEVIRGVALRNRTLASVDMS